MSLVNIRCNTILTETTLVSDALYASICVPDTDSNIPQITI
ncbi:MAG: hypothetical protein ACPG7F_14880 [Aggregatilineales bacterium]